MTCWQRSGVRRKYNLDRPAAWGVATAPEPLEVPSAQSPPRGLHLVTLFLTEVPTWCVFETELNLPDAGGVCVRTGGKAVAAASARGGGQIYRVLEQSRQELPSSCRQVRVSAASLLLPGVGGGVDGGGGGGRRHLCSPALPAA